jgi:hypothetical protein
MGQIIEGKRVKNKRPREPELANHSEAVTVAITGEENRIIQVRKDSSIEEILGTSLLGEAVLEEASFRLLLKPEKMKDGAIFRYERILGRVRLNLEYHTWDNRVLKFGVKVSAL